MLQSPGDPTTACKSRRPSNQIARAAFHLLLLWLQEALLIAEPNQTKRMAPVAPNVRVRCVTPWHRSIGWGLNLQLEAWWIRSSHSVAVGGWVRATPTLPQRLFFYSADMGTSCTI
jgi:hypothetical protein